MKKHILLLIILSTLLLSNEKVTLQLSWLHQFQFAGYYIAKEKGYYKDVGIDVEINEFQFGLDLSKVLETNQADFAIGRSSLLIDKFNGKDIVALGAIYQSSPLMLLVTKKSGIKTIEDFRNKKIMITSDAKSSASIIAMLNSKGVSLDDVTIQNHSFNLDDLINAKTDAMASYVSNEPIRLNEKNIEYKVFHPKDYGFRFYDDILFTSSKFIKENPKLTKDFFEATLKGWEYAFKHIGETSEIIYEKYNSQNKTLIQLVKEGESLEALAYDREDHKIGCIDKDVLKEIIQTYKVLGLMSEDIDLDSFVYEYNPHQFYEFKLTDSDIIFYIIIASLLMFIIISTILYSSIKGKLLHTNTKLQIEIDTAKEELLKHQQILLEHSKITSISKLLQNISHQWRQPLNVVSMGLSNIKMEIELGNNLNTNEVNRYINRSLKQLQYISKIIDDFSSYLDNKEIDTQLIETKLFVINFMIYCKVILMKKESSLLKR